MSHTLLILDLQLGNFVGSPPIFQGKFLLENTGEILSAARKVKAKVIFIQHMGGTGDPDEPGTKGWEIHPSIKPQNNEVVLQKTTPDSFFKTELDVVLKSMNVQTLIVLGLQTEYCIDTTVRRAYTLGYNVLLVKDCHSTWNSEDLSASQIIRHHNNVLGGYFAKLVTTNEILEKYLAESK